MSPLCHWLAGGPGAPLSRRQFCHLVMSRLDSLLRSCPKLNFSVSRFVAAFRRKGFNDLHGGHRSRWQRIRGFGKCRDRLEEGLKAAPERLSSVSPRALRTVLDGWVATRSLNQILNLGAPRFHISRERPRGFKKTPDGQMEHLRCGRLHTPAQHYHQQ